MRTTADNPQWQGCDCGELRYRCRCRFRLGDAVTLRGVAGVVTGTDSDGVWVRWASGLHNRVPWCAATMGVTRAES